MKTIHGMFAAKPKSTSLPTELNIQIIAVSYYCSVLNFSRKKLNHLNSHFFDLVAVAYFCCFIECSEWVNLFFTFILILSFGIVLDNKIVNKKWLQMCLKFSIFLLHQFIYRHIRAVCYSFQSILLLLMMTTILVYLLADSTSSPFFWHSHIYGFTLRFTFFAFVGFCCWHINIDSFIPLFVNVVCQALYDHRPSDADVNPTEAWLSVMEQAHLNMSRLLLKLFFVLTAVCATHSTLCNWDGNFAVFVYF